MSLAGLRLKFQAVIGDSGGDVGVLGFVFGDWFGTGLVLEMIGVVRDLSVEGLAGLGKNLALYTGQLLAQGIFSSFLVKFLPVSFPRQR